MKQSADVVIIGGGPTGLLLACELALAGVRPVLLERRTARIGQSRAMGMQARTIEILALRGLADRFISRGVKVPAGHYAGLEVGLDFSPLESKHAFGLFIPQTVTEELLEERALELGVDLRRGAKVEGINELPDGIEISGTGPEGSFEIATRYLVGADGARSIVREQSGIPFPGNDVDKTFYFGDIGLINPPAETSFRIRTDQGAIVAAYFGDGRYRLVFIDPERFSVPVATPVTLEEIQDGLDRILGPGVTATDPQWLSRFGNETKLATHFRQRSVFLAGDAAHIHLPVGGQGMNTSMQDAMNLGWKLASVIRGLAPEALLDSYEAERRPIGTFLIDNTYAQSAVLAAFGAEGKALREMMNDLLRIPLVNRKFAGELSALDLHYPGPLYEGHDLGAEGWAGRRLSDVDVRLASGEQSSLYALLAKGQWLDLQFEAGAEFPLPQGLARDLVRIERASLLDEGSSLRDLRAVLVRPDGHVAYALGR